MEGELNSTLPPNVDRVLTGFVEAARSAFDNDLRAVVLYGSGAEGKLRATSDVNVLLVLSAFEQKKADQLREPLRLAQAAIRLRAMFLLEAELQPAIAAFAVKFGDILRRHRVLYGEDPFAGVNSISRGDAIARLKQTLLNLTLRLREAYIMRSLREEQLIAMIADMAGPLRSCAATLLELEGKHAESPKEALHQVAASLPNGAQWSEGISLISEARQERALAHGVAAPTLFHLIELARMMWTRAAALS
jgi:predicted nucleotidyltransferase